MKSQEHRAVGHAATAGAFVRLGGTSAEESLVLSYGDVVALSGDFFTSRHREFASHHCGIHGGEDTQARPEGLGSDDLFRRLRSV